MEDLTKLAGEDESRELLVSSILSLGCPGNRKNEDVETVKLVIKREQSKRLDSNFPIVVTVRKSSTLVKVRETNGRVLLRYRLHCEKKEIKRTKGSIML